MYFLNFTNKEGIYFLKDNTILHTGILSSSGDHSSLYCVFLEWTPMLERAYGNLLLKLSCFKLGRNRMNAHNNVLVITLTLHGVEHNVAKEEIAICNSVKTLPTMIQKLSSARIVPLIIKIDFVSHAAQSSSN